ncbi:hypothetical protein Cantr_09090 [Candida viswanathii]|uniref:C3H1-type domain-containing protein n=1 Tax=Candida viswanathii TaxID=5486 RepID=A0A367Y8S1_9ASCO|nr:hypothetical protein Cantr_09090 [Candida viswanathii]
MSSTDPNEEALRLKYAEVAALKAALAQKQALKRRQEAHAARIQKRSKYGNQHPSYPQPRKFGNLKLVMNNGTTQEGSSSEPSSEGYVSVQSSGGNTLYNVNVYQEEAEKLKKKIELKKKQVQEQRRIKKLKARISRQRARYVSADRIKINGDKYSVIKGGYRLIPTTMFQTTNPDTCVWNGIKYKRAENTGTFKPLEKIPKTKHSKEVCKYFQNTGMCEKGSLCKYAHNKDMIRICPLFLAGKCYGRNCLLSHSPNDSNTPACRYYLDKTCTNPTCKYRHFKPDYYDDPNYEILTCRPFAIGGYCARGKKCPFLHLPNCPDFEEDNYCRYGRECALTHRFTLRTQDQIATRSNKYIREETVVTKETTPTPQKQIISSYTVDPKLLFAVDLTGNYQYYIDNEGNLAANDSKEFLIELSDSEEDDIDSETEGFDEEDGEEDDLELNDDYVGV